MRRALLALVGYRPAIELELLRAELIAMSSERDRLRTDRNHLLDLLNSPYNAQQAQQSAQVHKAQACQ